MKSNRHLIKRGILILALTALLVPARANIAAPRARISEIAFDVAGNWTLELGFYSYDFFYIDSIRFESSNGSAKISSCTLIYGGGYPNFDSLVIITNANLLTPVSVSPMADYVKVTSYISGYGNDDFVAIGNYPGSFLDCRQNGESVSFVCDDSEISFKRSFAIDQTPTIGAGNDTTGAYSSFSGRVFDPSGNVFTQGFFSLLPALGINVDIQPDGSFNERVFARRYAFDTITIWFAPWPYTANTYTVEPVDFCVRPDSLHTQDIITTSLVTAIDHHDPGQASMVVVSPNPFTTRVTFFFASAKMNPADDLVLSIHSRDGRLIRQARLDADANKFDWIPDEYIPAGVLVFRLAKNGQTMQSGTLLKL